MIVVKGENGILFNPVIIKVVNVPFGGAKIIAKNEHGSVWSNEIEREGATKAIDRMGSILLDSDIDNWYLDLTNGFMKMKKVTEWKSSEKNESDLNPKGTEESGN